MKTINKIKTLIAFSFIVFSANATVHTYNQQSGSFSVTGTSYIDGMNEIYYINTGIAKPISLTFQIDTEEECDYIYIYSIDLNGVESASPIVSYSGNIEAGYFSTMIPSGRVKVVFLSDNSCNNDCGYSGFEMSFSVDNNSLTSSVNSYISGNSYVGGNLGVGTMVPNQKLEVNGNALVYNKLTVGSTYINSSAKLGLSNMSDTYSLYSSSYKNATTPLYGIYSSASNNSGNVYGIYSNVSGQTGKRWAGYFNGGDVEVNNGSIKASADLILGPGNKQFIFHTQSWRTTDPPIVLIAPKLNSSEWDWSKQIVLDNTGSILLSGGKIGIGTTTPQAKLDVVGDITFGQDASYNILKGRSAGGAIKIGTNSGTWDRNMYLGFVDNNSVFSSVLSLIHQTGNVGIGTTSPDELLTVKGIIHAREVKVDLTGALADFVFNTDYQLMPLTEVERFVKTNKHLPSIPSANEVKENGLNMGEMQNKLLQKIEELTLYLIEQQKTIAAQNKRIEDLESRK